jgi:hypothetical protein
LKKFCWVGDCEKSSAGPKTTTKSSAGSKTTIKVLLG